MATFESGTGSIDVISGSKWLNSSERSALHLSLEAVFSIFVVLLRYSALRDLCLAEAENLLLSYARKRLLLCSGMFKLIL